MTPEWVDYFEKRSGANDPYGRADTFNRANKQIFDNFSAHGTTAHGEHDRDGDHCADLLSSPGVYKVEAFTYTGNGADDRTITLTSNIIIKFIRIFDAVDTYTFFRSNSVGGDVTISTEGTAMSDRIQSVGTGSFQVGITQNVNSRVYYGVAYGILSIV